MWGGWVELQVCRRRNSSLTAILNISNLIFSSLLFEISPPNPSSKCHNFFGVENVVRNTVKVNTRKGPKILGIQNPGALFPAYRVLWYPGKALRRYVSLECPLWMLPLSWVQKIPQNLCCNRFYEYQNVAKHSWVEVTLLEPPQAKKACCVPMGEQRGGDVFCPVVIFLHR